MTSRSPLVTLTEAALPSLLELEQAAHPGGWTERALLDELTAADSVLRGCFSSTALVAYAAWRALPGELWLHNLTVAISARRAGLGSALLEDGRALAAERGLPELWLEVRSRNEPALRLYRGAGFTERGRRPTYYAPLSPGGPRDDAIMMMAST